MIFERTPRKAAFFFCGLMWMYLIQVICLILSRAFPILLLIALPAILGTILCAGLVAYEIGWHPVQAILGAILFCVPFISIIFLLYLISKAKAYLEWNDYEIVLRGARHVPPDE